jgi:hypothetical protein
MGQLTNIGLHAFIQSPLTRSKLVHHQSRFPHVVRWRHIRLVLEAGAAFLGQMANQVLQEASVNPGRMVRTRSHQRPLLICEGFDPEPRSQPLEFGQAVIGVEKIGEEF